MQPSIDGRRPQRLRTAICRGNSKESLWLPTSIQEIETSYRNYLADELDLAPTTIEGYLVRAHSLLKDLWLTRSKKLKELSPSKVISLLLVLIKKSKQNTTLVATINAWKSFFRYAFQAKLYSKDYSHCLMSAPTYAIRGRIRSLPFNDIENLINGCKTNRGHDYRNQAMITLMAYQGLRRCEVCSLQFNDFDPSQGRLYIVDRHGRREAIKLSAVSIVAISKYLEMERPNIDTQSLFISSTGRGLTPDGLSEVIYAAFKTCNINPPGNVCTHVFRHSLAMNLLRDEFSLEYIQRILRHKNITTTQVYAKVDFTSLAQVVARCPRRK